MSETSCLSMVKKLSILFFIQANLYIFYRSSGFTFEIMMIFFSKANSMATWLTSFWTNMTLGFNLNTWPRQVFNMFPTLLTNSSNFKLLAWVKDSADIAGFMVTNLGYFKCISKFLEGMFFCKTRPFTQAAVTDSGGAMIVSTLIY